MKTMDDRGWKDPACVVGKRGERGGGGGGASCMRGVKFTVFWECNKSCIALDCSWIGSAS